LSNARCSFASLQEEIKLQDLDGAAVQVIIEYLYTSKIELTDESVIDILHAACMLCIEAVTDHVPSWLLLPEAIR
jgi:hypothetical protein